MRIHSDFLDLDDIYAAARGAGIAVDVEIRRSHDCRRRFDVYAYGSSHRRSQHDRDRYTATYDEYGVFLARLFRIDSTARVGDRRNPVYTDAEDFHMATLGRYRALTPEPGHDHRWQSVWGEYLECRTCGAVVEHPCATADRRAQYATIPAYAAA